MFRVPNPSPNSAGGDTELPSPPRGEGAIAATALAATWTRGVIKLLRQHRRQPLARLRDHRRHRRFVRRRHDVHAGDAGDGGELRDQPRGRCAGLRATGSAARSSRATNASGMMVPHRCSFIQRADFAERSGAMPTIRARPRVPSWRGEALAHSGARSRHPCRTGSARTARRPRPWRRA